MPSDSSPSSSLLSIISGLLATVAIEDTVFLRSSALLEGGTGEVTGSFGAADVFRESQEKGLVNFLDGGGAGPPCIIEAGGACGGGDQGPDGSTPDSP